MRATEQRADAVQPHKFNANTNLPLPPRRTVARFLLLWRLFVRSERARIFFNVLAVLHCRRVAPLNALFFHHHHFVLHLLCVCV